jgi:hypothetical protein
MSAPNDNNSDTDTDSDDSNSPQVYRDRHEHGGASDHPDDDELARRTERERVDAGLEAYDPDDVPPATDVDATPDLTSTEEFQEAAAEVRRQESDGELGPLTTQHPFPPSHYERS